MIAKNLFKKIQSNYFFSTAIPLNSFNKLEDLNAYLEKKKPTFSVIYFRSNWNPQC